MNIAKHHRTPSSCILPRRRQIERLRQFPAGLFDHVVAIGSWLLTLENAFDHVIVVCQCLSIFCHEQEQKRKTVLLRASGNRSPRSSMIFLLGLRRFCHVLVNSAHHVVLKQRFDQNFNAISIFMATNFHVQDWTDSRILENPSFRIFFSHRSIVYSRHKCCILCPSSVSSEKKFCPVPTSFKPASEHSLDNFWSSDIFSNLRSWSCTKFHRYCSLVREPAIEGPVGISIVSK